MCASCSPTVTGRRFPCSDRSSRRAYLYCIPRPWDASVTVLLWGTPCFTTDFPTTRETYITHDAQFVAEGGGKRQTSTGREWFSEVVARGPQSGSLASPVWSMLTYVGSVKGLTRTFRATWQAARRLRLHRRPERTTRLKYPRTRQDPQSQPYSVSSLSWSILS